MVPIDNRLYGCIGTASQEEQTYGTESNIKDETPPSSQPSNFVVLWSKIGPTHAHVRDAPGDETKEGIKERAHEREQIREERNDFGNDPGKNPGDGQNSGPAGPPDDSVVGEMSASLEKIEKDEASGHRGVEHTQENERRNHEAERNFLVHLVAQAAKGWGGVVLGAGVAVDNTADQAEQDNFGNRDRPQSLGKIARFFHFSNEWRECNLTNECVADVHKSIHTVNKGGSLSGDNQNNWLS